MFSIDTPPPTVTVGPCTWGTCFSYTQTDCVPATSGCGRGVFYPMGGTTHGPAHKRRVQNYFGVRCDPSVPTTRTSRRPPTPLSPAHRPAELHRPVPATHRDRRAGLRGPVPAPRRVGGLGPHVHHHRRAPAGGCRSGPSCATWPAARLPGRGPLPVGRRRTFRHRVAQAELEDRPRPGAPSTGWPSLAADGGGDILIETTARRWWRLRGARGAPRRRALPAPVRLDGRVPLFDTEVPVLAHALAEPGKATGIAHGLHLRRHRCRVTWWRELELPVRPIIGPDGRMLPSRRGSGERRAPGRRTPRSPGSPPTGRAAASSSSSPTRAPSSASRSPPATP